jgi:hypothetical protein
MHNMIEKERKGFGKVAGKIKAWNRNRIAEKKRIHEKEEVFKKQLEDRFIRQRVEKRLRMKYTQPAFGWSLPKSGQRSVGESILEGIAGREKKKKK